MDGKRGDVLGMVILGILAQAGRPMTAEKIADQLARLVLEAQRMTALGEREQGH